MPFTPHDAATHTIALARHLLSASSQGNLPPGVCEDLRRLALVMAVAALDTYMHRLIIARAYEHDEMPGGLANLTVTFGELIFQADAAVAARKDDRDARPRVAAKRILRNRLVRDTFQRSDDISKALAMAGKSRQWDQIARAMPPASPAWTSQSLRTRLDEIVDRRNSMVHEGDYERLDRPQVARLVAMPEADADAAVSFMADLIDAIHGI